MYWQVQQNWCVLQSGVLLHSLLSLVQSIQTMIWRFNLILSFGALEGKKKASDNFSGPVKCLNLGQIHCSNCATKAVQFLAVTMGEIWKIFLELVMDVAHLCKGIRKMFQRV